MKPNEKVLCLFLSLLLLFNSVPFGVSLPTFSETTPVIALSKSELAPGETVTITASGFPAAVVVKSILVWQNAQGHGIFITQLTSGGKTYAYSGDPSYDYRAGSQLLKTDSSGKLVVQVQVPNSAVSKDNYVRIWTDGFKAGTEADAKVNFTLKGSATVAVPTETGLPVISKVESSSASVGDVVRVSGKGFGSTENNLLLTKKGEMAVRIPAEKWSDTLIEWKVPEYLDQGIYEITVHLNSNGKVSNGMTITIGGAAVVAPTQSQLKLKVVQQPGAEVTASSEAGFVPPITFGLVDGMGQPVKDKDITLLVRSKNDKMPILKEHYRSAVVTFKNGVATLSKAFLPFVGNQYVLEASVLGTNSDGIEPIDTNAFNVLPSSEQSSSLVVEIQEPIGNVPGIVDSVLKVYDPRVESGAFELIKPTGQWPLSVTFKHLKPGNLYRVDLETKEGQRLDQVPLLSLNENQETKVTLSPAQRAEVSVSVVDQSANPVEGAQVTVIHEASKKTVYYGWTDKKGLSNAIKELPVNGNYKIIAKPGQNQKYLINGSEAIVALKPGNNSVELRLEAIAQATGKIMGTVTDGRGKPAAQVTVSANVFFDGRYWHSTAETDVLGHYEIDTIYPGDVEIQAATAFSVSKQFVVKLQEGATQTQDLQVVPSVKDVYVKVKMTRQFFGNKESAPELLSRSTALRNGLEFASAGRPLVMIGDQEGYIVVRGIITDQQIDITAKTEDLKLNNQVISVDLEERSSNQQKTLFGEGTIKLSAPTLLKANAVDEKGQKISRLEGILSRVVNGQEETIRIFDKPMGQIEMALPGNGDYSLYLSADQGAAKVNFKGTNGRMIDLGKVMLKKSLRFTAPKTTNLIRGSAVQFVETLAVPGNKVTIKGHYQNQGASAFDTELLMTLPKGVSLVGNSVELNGLTVPVTTEGSYLVAKVGKVLDKASGSFSAQCLIPEGFNESGISFSARMRFKDAPSGAAKVELLDQAYVALHDLMIKGVGVTTKRQMVLSGQSSPNTEVGLFAEGQVQIGTAMANEFGQFEAEVTLPDFGERKYAYRVQARTLVNDVLRFSKAIKVVYDPLMPELTQIKVGQGESMSVSFDPRLGQVKAPIPFNPSAPMEIEVTVNDSNRVNEIVAQIGKIGQVTLNKTSKGTYKGEFPMASPTVVPGDLTIAMNSKYIFGDFYAADNRQIKDEGIQKREMVEAKLPQTLQNPEITNANFSKKGNQEIYTSQVKFPGIDRTFKVETLFEKDAGSYMPSATDRALAKASGIPIFGHSLTSEIENGQRVIIRKFYYFNELSDAEKAMQDDPMPEFFLQKIFTGGTSDELISAGNDLVNLYGFSQTNGASAASSYANMDNAGKIEWAYEHLSELYTNGEITQAQFDTSMAALRAQMDLVEQSAVASTLFDLTASSVLETSGGTAVVATGALSFVSGGGGFLLDFANEWEIDNIISDMDTQAMQNEIEHQKAMLRTYTQVSKSIDAYYAEDNRKADALIAAIRLSNNWLIDPSGYVYEGVPDNRLSQVKATVLKKDEASGVWLPWRADDYGQMNPQVTLADGNYRWDVTPGSYQVLYEKEGYDSVLSEVMNIPPPRVDVNIDMVQKAPPAVTGVTASGDGKSVMISFNQYMVADDFRLNPESLKCYDSSKKLIKGTYSAISAQKDLTGRLLTKGIQFVPLKALAAETQYHFVLGEGLRNHGGKSLVADPANALLSFKVAKKLSVPKVTGVQTLYTKGAEIMLIKGANLLSVDGVQFGSYKAKTVIKESDSQLKVTIPAGQGIAEVQLKTAAGLLKTGFVKNFGLANNKLPVITSISKMAGAAAGGELITIKGSGFFSVKGVLFGSVKAEAFKVVSDKIMTMKTPMGYGDVPLTLLSSQGDLPQFGRIYHYQEDHMTPVGKDGTTIKMLQQSTQVTVLPGTLSSWQVIRVKELDASRIAKYKIKALGSIVEVSMEKSVKTLKPIELKLAYDPKLLKKGQSPVVYDILTGKPVKATFKNGMAVILLPASSKMTPKAFVVGVK